MSWALTAVQAANEDIAGCHKLSDYAWITGKQEITLLYLQIQPAPAVLAHPAITPQHSLPELFVRLGIKPQAWLFGQNQVREAFWVTSCRKACR